MNKKGELDQEADGVSGEEAPAAEGVYEGPKKIIAATKFKSTSGIHWDAGEALGAMLSESLMATGRFIVVERAEVDDLIKEQDLGAEGRVTQATAAKFGNMLGASILVMGTVTQLEEQAAGQGGGVGVPLPGVGSVSLGGGKMTAYVKINLRLVDTETGKILSTHNADGTATAKSRGGGLGVKGFTLNGEESKKTPIGQACQDAIDQAVAHIIKTMESVPFYAKVADISGSDITINAGTNRNMKPGMVLEGYKVVKEIKDPDTGLVISVQEEKTGAIRIREVQEKISVAEKIEGEIGPGQKLKLKAAAE
ncbi:MAG: hypothetical protein JXR94_00210 [Candidatus Hydrogenedentes bacterium]|nr:hypothetical protein [Candidatus Hydrogenedentota bacterium]